MISSLFQSPSSSSSSSSSSPWRPAMPPVSKPTIDLRMRIMWVKYKPSLPSTATTTTTTMTMSTTMDDNIVNNANNNTTSTNNTYYWWPAVIYRDYQEMLCHLQDEIDMETKLKITGNIIQLAFRKADINNSMNDKDNNKNTTTSNNNILIARLLGRQKKIDFMEITTSCYQDFFLRLEGVLTKQLSKSSYFHNQHPSLYLDFLRAVDEARTISCPYSSSSLPSLLSMELERRQDKQQDQNQQQQQQQQQDQHQPSFGEEEKQVDDHEMKRNKMKELQQDKEQKTEPMIIDHSISSKKEYDSRKRLSEELQSPSQRKCVLIGEDDEASCKKQKQEQEQQSNVHDIFEEYTPTSATQQQVVHTQNTTTTTTTATTRSPFVTHQNSSNQITTDRSSNKKTNKDRTPTSPANVSVDDHSSYCNNSTISSSSLYATTTKPTTPTTPNMYATTTASSFKHLGEEEDPCIESTDPWDTVWKRLQFVGWTNCKQNDEVFYVPSKDILRRNNCTEEEVHLTLDEIQGLVENLCSWRGPLKRRSSPRKITITPIAKKSTPTTNNNKKNKNKNNNNKNTSKNLKIIKKDQEKIPIRRGRSRPKRNVKNFNEVPKCKKNDIDFFNFKVLWEEYLEKYKGWKWITAPDNLHNWVYIRGDKTVETGTYLEDYFYEEYELLEYAKNHPNWFKDYRKLLKQEQQQQQQQKEII